VAGRAGADPAVRGGERVSSGDDPFLPPVPAPPAAPLPGRILRLIRKELNEILRDRRTITTLVLMPLLLYPLLSLAFQQFLLASDLGEKQKGKEEPKFRFCFSSKLESVEFLDLVLYARLLGHQQEVTQAPRVPLPELDISEIVFEAPPEQHEDLLRLQQIDLAIRRTAPDPKQPPPLRE